METQKCVNRLAEKWGLFLILASASAMWQHRAMIKFRSVFDGHPTLRTRRSHIVPIPSGREQF